MEVFLNSEGRREMRPIVGSEQWISEQNKDKAAEKAEPVAKARQAAKPAPKKEAKPAAKKPAAKKAAAPAKTVVVKPVKARGAAGRTASADKAPAKRPARTAK